METMKMEVAANLSVEVRPNTEHEFIMRTNEVAKGYGVSGGAIRRHMERNPLEFIEGKHFIKGATICHTLAANAQPHQIFWTKRGIVRLGFFIKSERARMFRDWAEDLIVGTLDMTERAQSIGVLPETPKRKHNRLTPDRMVNILADVAKIEDKALRLSLVAKLTNQ